MKTPTLLFFLFCAALRAEDIKTTDGQVFKDATITGKDALGVIISHSDGIARVAYDKLPEELRKQYNYEPKQAQAQLEAERKAAMQRAQAALTFEQPQVPTPPPSLKLGQLMRPEQIKDMGLDKLSPEEIQKLEAWLTRFAGVVTQAATGAPAAPAAGAAGAAVESRIDGTFEGWTGDTIFKLVNGQLWQQAGYAYTYHYAFQPKVIIFKDGAAFRMKVDGVSDSLSVKRLK